MYLVHNLIGEYFHQAQFDGTYNLFEWLMDSISKKKRF